MGGSLGDQEVEFEAASKPAAREIAGGPTSLKGAKPDIDFGTKTTIVELKIEYMGSWRAGHCPSFTGGTMLNALAHTRVEIM